MAASARPATKKFFTASEANAMLPLVKLIVRDIATLTAELRAGKLRQADLRAQATLSKDERAELEHLEAENDRIELQFWQHVEELDKLRIELKDPSIGLIDFPCRKEGREVYLCWKLGEEAVTHWHELHTGFAGRQPIHEDDGLDDEPN